MVASRLQSDQSVQLASIPRDACTYARQLHHPCRLHSLPYYRITMLLLLAVGGACNRVTEGAVYHVC